MFNLIKITLIKFNLYNFIRHSSLYYLILKFKNPSYTKSLNKDFLFLEEEDKFFFIEAKKYIENIENKCNEKIQNLCNHCMIDDFIDISPSISKNIRYCELCEYTEPN